MSDSKTIYTPDGITVPWLEKTSDNYLDKTTLIFGGSNSGKSTLIEEILYLTRDHIPNYLFVMPPTSNAPYRNKVPARCVKEDLTRSMLKKIWDRQVFMTQIYKVSNNFDNLESIFNKIQDVRSIVMVKAICHRTKAYTESIDSDKTLDFAQKRAKRIKIETRKKERLTDIYKDSIRHHRDRLLRMQLSEEEAIAVEYLDINPRLMLVIDDCSEKFRAWMKMFSKNEDNIFECVFYRGRHNFISLVFAAHDDKLIDTELRKNARVTIWTTSQAVVASFNKAQSGFTNQEKKNAFKIADRLFKDEDGKENAKPLEKFCYIKDSNKPFQYTIADTYPDFNLGCGALRMLNDKLPKADDGLKTNPFLKHIYGGKNSKGQKNKGR